MSSYVLIANACAQLGIDPLARGLQIVNAPELARLHHPPLDPARPALLAPVDSRETVLNLKLVLLRTYPPAHPLTHTPTRQTISLSDLDSLHALTSDSALYLPPLENAGSLYALAEIVARLRAPDGCEWDRAQTRATMRAFLLEEAYEVVDAIERGDLPHLREELGDLLFHVFFQAQVAAEAGEFRLGDVAREIADKLVRRHPHIFGDAKVNGTDEILAQWGRIKESEKRESQSGKREARGAQTEIPLVMPALMRAQKVAEKRKARVSLKEVAASVEKIARAKNKEQKLGEALFALVAYAAEEGIDAESALRAYTT